MLRTRFHARCKDSTVKSASLALYILLNPPLYGFNEIQMSQSYAAQARYAGLCIVDIVQEDLL